jgi:small subunit ribosomal protein S11
MAAGKERKTKKKVRKNIPEGVAHITATFNNTLITITDMEGNSICWSSSGSHGFKGSKKGTSFASQVAAAATARTARDNGVRTLDIRLLGPGAGREAAVRALAGAGIQIRSIRDVTPVPHNGCRPRKRRRV